MLRIFLIILSIMLFSTPSFAKEDIPKKESLKEIQERIAQSKEKKEKLQKELSKLQTDIKGLKTNLVNTAEKVQKNENDLDKVEKEINALNAQKSKILADLDNDRQALAGLIIALERIKRIPPETLIARPDAPVETAQAATILGAIMPELNKRTIALQDKLNELKNIEANLNNNKDKLSDATASLKSEKEKMAQLVEARKKNIDVTQGEFKEAANDADTLSKKAKNLEDLIAKIESQRIAREKKKKNSNKEKFDRNYNDDAYTRKNHKVDESKLASSLSGLGNARMPVSGTIKINYGQKDEIGATSEGMKIASRSGSVVISPMNGTVAYAGPFKKYGSIILIEHKGNYHSLIAGLGKIDVSVGQNVDAGEPIGNLGGASLYYELRYNGNPINPARKFSNLD